MVARNGASDGMPCTDIAKLRKRGAYPAGCACEASRGQAFGRKLEEGFGCSINIIERTVLPVASGFEPLKLCCSLIVELN